MSVPAWPDWDCVSPLMPPPKARKRHQAAQAGIGPGEWLTAVAPSCPTHCATACWKNGPYDAAKRPVLHCHTACFTRQNGLCRLFKKTRTRHRKPPLLLSRDKVAAHGLRAGLLTRAESQLPSTACPIRGWAFAIALPTVWATGKAAAWHGVRYFGDACQSPKRERSGLRDLRDFGMRPERAHKMVAKI